MRNKKLRSQRVICSRSFLGEPQRRAKAASRSRGAHFSSGVSRVSWRCLCLCYVP